MKKLDVKAIFFDFDDTLQSRKQAYRVYSEVFMDKYFPNVTAEKREQMLDDMENLVDGGYKAREVYFPELIEKWQWTSHPEMQELIDHFNYEFGHHVVLLDDSIEVLTELRNRGYILGVITNGLSILQNTKIDTAKIRDMFDVVVVSGDIDVYKPDRAIYDYAMQKAGVKADESVYIGDHPINDMQGSMGAGMYAIRMNYGDFYGKSLNQEGVFAEIEKLTQLYDYLVK